MAWDDEEFSLSQFSNGGTMDDIRFDDRLTPPYRSTVDIEGPQESVAEYANPQAASNYVGGFDANWAETPQRQPWNHQEPFAPHQIYTQYPTGGYGEHHEHDSGDTVGGTRGDLDQTQSMGAFSFQQGMSMETNNGSSQQGYANNHQGSVEQGATQFNDQHCIYALLPAASVMASTIPDITARLAEYEEAGWTHIRLQRDGIQVQGECSFSVKALLSFFRHVGKARPLQVTFREFMDPLVVLDKDIMERLQACVTTKVDLQPITLFDDVDVGLPFRFQLYNDKHWESGWDVPNSVVIALFIALGRQLEFKALSELMSKIPSARASTSDLEYLGQRLHAMRLAFRKRSQEVTPSTTTVLLGELCKNLAMLHHLKQDDMAKKSKSAAVHCPSIPTLFPHGPTEQAIAEWLVSL
ncbi:hypothetical protein O9K51_03252 [Purpureocillium lavendulum]|uniref:Uncharacterized protein n=1 Tax=Purpureocillium lavendulum TaxID=1247861 RepID=A0AB34FZN8_9HYPO|nr:hypothetical protein O9K51_03252 [Purpureocillium lavendulum]